MKCAADVDTMLFFILLLLGRTYQTVHIFFTLVGVLLLLLFVILVGLLLLLLFVFIKPPDVRLGNNWPRLNLDFATIPNYLLHPRIIYIMKNISTSLHSLGLAWSVIAVGCCVHYSTTRSMICVRIECLCIGQDLQDL
jgi:hypothetical protein